MYFVCIHPGVDQGEQGVLGVQVQLGQQGLDGHGGHFLTTWWVVVNHNQGQRGKEQAVVLLQQVLNGENKNTTELLFWCWNAESKICWHMHRCYTCRHERKYPHLRESLKDECQHLQHRLPACVMLICQLSHNEVQVLSQLLPQWVVQKVL